MTGESRVGRFRRAIAVAITAAAVLGACGGDGDDIATGDTDSPATTATGNETESSGEVELLEQGAEPRSTMRLTLREGHESRSVMTMRMGIEMTVDGQTFPSGAIPPMRVVMTARIEGVSDGSARFAFGYEDGAAVAEPGADPAVLDAVNQLLGQLNGVQGSGTITARGSMSDVTSDTVSITDPTLKSTLDSMTSQMESMAVPFPAEPVGVGAKWRATRSVVLNGITTNTTNTYTLKKHDGRSYEMDIEQQLTAPTGAAAVPGLPPGTTAEIVKYDGANSGSIAGSLDAIFPQQSAIGGMTNSQMRVMQGGKPSVIVQKLTIDVRIEPA